MKSLDLMGLNFSVDFCTACRLSQLDSIPRLTPEIFSVLPRMGHASTIWMQGVQVKSLGMADAQAFQLRPELPYKFRRCWLIKRSDLSALKLRDNIHPFKSYSSNHTNKSETCSKFT